MPTFDELADVASFCATFLGAPPSNGTWMRGHFHTLFLKDMIQIFFKINSLGVSETAAISFWFYREAFYLFKAQSGFLKI